MPNSAEILNTARLRLRRLQPVDIPALIALWTDPEVTRYLGGPREKERLLAILEESAQQSFQDRFGLWPVVEKGTGQVIGDCGLLEKDVDGKSEIELVYVLARSAWGRGYATEVAAGLKGYAFTTLELKRLIALIEPENGASERVAIKIGMQFEKEILRPGGVPRRVYAVEETGAT